MVASQVGSLNQIDKVPKISTTAVNRLMPCRVQNLVCTVVDLLRPAISPASHRDIRPTMSKTATKITDRRSSRTLSALTPAQSIPRTASAATNQ